MANLSMGLMANLSPEQLKQIQKDLVELIENMTPEQEERLRELDMTNHSDYRVPKGIEVDMLPELLGDQTNKETKE